MDTTTAPPSTRFHGDMRPSSVKILPSAAPRAGVPLSAGGGGGGWGWRWGVGGFLARGLRRHFNGKWSRCCMQPMCFQTIKSTVSEPYHSFLADGGAELAPVGPCNMPKHSRAPQDRGAFTRSTVRRRHSRLSWKMCVQVCVMRSYYCIYILYIPGTVYLSREWGPRIQVSTKYLYDLERSYFDIYYSGHRARIQALRSTCITRRLLSV